MKINYYRPRGRFFCSSFEVLAINPEGQNSKIVYGPNVETFKDAKAHFEKYYKKHGWVGVELRRSKPYPF